MALRSTPKHSILIVLIHSWCAPTEDIDNFFEASSFEVEDSLIADSGHTATQAPQPLQSFNVILG